MTDFGFKQVAIGDAAPKTRNTKKKQAMQALAGALMAMPAGSQPAAALDITDSPLAKTACKKIVDTMWSDHQIAVDCYYGAGQRKYVARTAKVGK